MLGEIFARITGVSPDVLKSQARNYLDKFARSIICECGDLKWQHIDGRCVRGGCDCKEFRARKGW